MVSETLPELIFNTGNENTIRMQNDYLVYGIIIAYFAFVTYLGPAFMRHRKALDIYYFVIIFNIVLGISNAYLCLTIGGVARKYWHYRCYFKSFPDYISAQKVTIYLGSQLFLLKIAELFDTVIFILRKKFNQVSLAHVFHHGIIAALTWANLKRESLPFYLLLLSSMNCGVHTVTYLYYGMSAIGPGMRKYLWWKKYLITIQILQFLVALLYLAYCFLSGCEEFAEFELMWFGTTLVVCVLFIHFYSRSFSQAK